MKKLWQKNTALNKEVEIFETQDDLVLDQKLIPYDLYGTGAHVQMLSKVGLLKLNEAKKLIKGLKQIKRLYEKGEFILVFGEEDMHTKIETYLTEQFGDVGQKVHTGRSRNDQVLTAIRLYEKDKILDLSEGIGGLAEAFLVFAKEYEFTPIPGYTHMQKAMPSSLGMWATSFVESLVDDLLGLQTAIQLVDQSPLGSAAGYGVPLPLDREYTAKLLGFHKVQANSLYCQNSRGKIEAVILAALVQVQLSINKFVSDVLLFTTSEFNYFSVADTLSSGSSIMPQKKNIDIAELLRAKVHMILAAYVQTVSLSANLPSGYNRDLQDSKKSLIESLELMQSCIPLAKLLLESLKPNKEILLRAMTPELLAAHQAFRLVNEGIPFREAYHLVGISLDSLPAFSKEVLLESQHTGGTGNLGIDQHFAALTDQKTKLLIEQKNFHKKLESLLNPYVAKAIEGEGR